MAGPPLAKVTFTPISLLFSSEIILKQWLASGSLFDNIHFDFGEWLLNMHTLHPWAPSGNNAPDKEMKGGSRGLTWLPENRKFDFDKGLLRIQSNDDRRIKDAFNGQEDYKDREPRIIMLAKVRKTGEMMRQIHWKHRKDFERAEAMDGTISHMHFKKISRSIRDGRNEKCDGQVRRIGWQEFVRIEGKRGKTARIRRIACNHDWFDQRRFKEIDWRIRIEYIEMIKRIITTHTFKNWARHFFLSALRLPFISQYNLPSKKW